MGPLTITTPAAEQDIESLAAAHTMLTFTLPLRPVQPLFEEHFTASPNAIDWNEDAFHGNVVANTIDAIETDLDDLLTDLTSRKVQLDTMSTILQWFEDPHSPEIGFPTSPMPCRICEEDDGYYSLPSGSVSAAVSESDHWTPQEFEPSLASVFPSRVNEAVESRWVEEATESQERSFASFRVDWAVEPPTTPNEITRDRVAKRAAARTDRYRERQRKRLAIRQRRKFRNMVMHMCIAADERERLLYALTPSEERVHVRRILGGRVIEVS